MLLDRLGFGAESAYRMDNLDVVFLWGLRATIGNRNIWQHVGKEVGTLKALKPSVLLGALQSDVFQLTWVFCWPI